MAQIIRGDLIAKEITDSIKEEVKDFCRKPKLAVIFVGDDFASEAYIRGKTKAGNRVGIDVEVIRFSKNEQERNIIESIESLNKDENIDGIIVQLPLPSHINESNVVNAVKDTKDVDGFTYYNAGRLFRGQPNLTPCTPKGIMHMLNRENVDLQGKNAVVIGRSNLVGLPLARMLTEANATVTLCHSRTKNLKDIASQADLLIVAIGKSKFITSEFIKKGAVVIDVGISRDNENKLSGDVDFEGVLDKVSKITPVPKGVGPLTIAMLLSNTVKAYKSKGD